MGNVVSWFGKGLEFGKYRAWLWASLSYLFWMILFFGDSETTCWNDLFVFKLKSVTLLWETGILFKCSFSLGSEYWLGLVGGNSDGR